MRNAALHLMDEKHVGVHTFLPNNDSSVVSPQLCNIQKWLKLTLGQHGKGVTGVPGGGGGGGGEKGGGEKGGGRASKLT